MFLTRFIISNVFSVFLIGAILLLKRVLKNKVSLKFHYHIWFVLLLSFVVAFLPTTFFKSIELGNITQEITAPAIHIEDDTLMPPDMPNDWRYDFTDLTDSSDKTVLNIGCKIFWIIGVVVVIAFYISGSKRLRKIKKFTEPLPDNIMSVVKNCCEKTAIKRKICVLQSDMVTSPLSFGYRQSYIILPSKDIHTSSQREIEHIILHELTHIRHNDILVNLWLCIEQMMFWFNPLIWWSFSKMRQDREAYCDWTVLNGYDTDDERLAYGDTLLRFASKKNNTLVYTANGLFSNKKQIKYRIERIADYKAESKLKKIVGKSIIMLLSFATMLQVPAFAAVASDFGLYYNPKQTMTVIEFDYSSLYGGADGCAVIYDTNANVYNVYNRDAITKRIAPCSTCKIYSALNALEQGIISASENTVQWDYLSRDIPSWNGNQNLNSAMKNSVNWYFQYLDNSVGADELESFYKRIGYGNGFIGNDTMYYWNGSKLKISPLEQVDLLKKLYNNKLGANKDNVSAIKDAIFIAERNGYRLYGKTGTGKIGNNDVSGWFIGFVETKDNVYFFAVNLQDDANANGNAAVLTTFSIFETMGIKLSE